MNRVAVIQARMGSQRLPGKVLSPLAGRSVLAWVLTRLQRCQNIDRSIIATSTEFQDEAIAQECAQLEIPCFRGSETDVLDRFYQAAKQAQADIVIRVTADSPCLDPQIIDLLLHEFLAPGERYDFASNVQPVRTFPQGVNAEVFRISSLREIHQLASSDYEREHVTPYFYRHPERYSLLSLSCWENLSAYRWTLDTEDDLEFIQQVYQRFPNSNFDWRSLLESVRLGDTQGHQATEGE